MSVDSDGNLVSYMAISVPPGIDGQQPSLSIRYSSGATNGKLGVGVKLGGLSAITRCPQIPAVDGRRGVVAFNQDDRYCLEGQRLINISGDYGKPGTIYRTERESWNLVASSDAVCGDGPCSFDVTDRDGAVRSYGGTPDSRALAGPGPTIRSWLVSASTDRNGNVVTYAYTGNAEKNPDISLISYGSNPKAGVRYADRFIRFVYSSTPRPDVIKNYVGGVSYAQSTYLRNIETLIRTEAVGNYSFSYKPSVATGRLLLQQIQRCSPSSCNPPTTFEWQGQSASTFTPEPLSFTKSQPAAINPSILDLNGDGIGDIAAITEDSSFMYVSPAISDGSKSFAVCPQTLKIGRNSNGRLLGADLNADGHADFIYTYDDRQLFAYSLYFGTPGGCDFKAGPSKSVNASAKPDYVWAADVNGDGKTDLIAAWKQPTGYLIAVMLSDGTSLRDPVFSRVTMSNSASQLYLADVNGDGMMDLVGIYPTQNGVLEVSVALSNGTGFGAPTTTQFTNVPSGSTIGIWPLDANHDGLTDLVLAQAGPNGALVLQPLFSTGNGKFVAGTRTQTTGPTSNILYIGPADTTGTGTPHIIELYAQGGGVVGSVFTAVGGAFDQGAKFKTQFTGDPRFKILAIDYHGTGRTGLVQFAGNAGISSLSGLSNVAAQADLVNVVTDAAGGRTIAGYAPLSSKQVYDPSSSSQGSATGQAMTYAYRMDPAASPFQRVGGGIRNVVAQMRRTNAPDLNSSDYNYKSTYFYRGGLIDLSGRGWLGFQSVSETQTDTGKVTVTDFNQAFPLTGTAAGVSIYCNSALTKDQKCSGGNVLLSKTTNHFVSKTVATGAPPLKRPILLPDLQETRVDAYDYGRPDITRIRQYQTDEYGNQTFVADLGVTGDNKPLYICSSFSNNVTAKTWVLGSTLYRKASASKACNNFDSFVDNVDLTLEHFNYDASFNVRSSGIYDDVNRLYLTATFDYDSFGNRTGVTVPNRSVGQSTTTTTYETAFHTYADSVISATNTNGLKATTRYGFDPRFGKQVATQTSNGEISVSCADAFGNITQNQGPTPKAPSGVRPDTNCLGTSTGDRARFVSASVVTTRRSSRSRDDRSRIYLETKSLNAWPVGGAANLLSEKAYTDGLGRLYMGIAQDDATSPTKIVCTNLLADGTSSRTSLPAFLTNQTCTSSTGTGFEWATEAHDAYGRMLEIKTPLNSDGLANSTVRYAYGPHLTATVTKGADSADAVQTVVTAGYFNGERKIISVLVPASGKDPTTYQYDLAGRLTAIHEPATVDNPTGIPTTIKYDSVGRRIRLDDPDQNTTGDPSIAAQVWEYGSDGLLSSLTDAKRQATRFTAYDALGRVLTKVDPDATTTYGYDDPNVGGVGRLTSTKMTVNGASAYKQTYGYDAYGNRSVTSLDLAEAGRRYDDAQVFDPKGRLLSETFPNGSRLERAYAGDKLKSLKIDGAVVATYSDFTAFGSAKTVTYSDGAVSTYEYLANGLTNNEKLTDKQGGRLLDTGLTWNGLLSLHKLNDHLKPNGVDYSEDYTYAIGRLATASAPGLYGRETYGYSANGNQTSVNSQNWTYTAHRLLKGTDPAGATVLSVGYDADGNVISRTDHTDRADYAYDARNQLKKVTTSAGTMLLNTVFADSGRRLAKKLPDGSEVFYPVPNYMVTRLAGQPERVTVYVATGSRTVAQADYDAALEPSATPLVPRIRIIYSNQVRSTTITLDQKGAASSRIVYVPFGAMSDKSSGTDDVARKFQGKEFDKTSGLYNFGARFYDPQIGHFGSADSRLGSHLYRIDSLNRYAFALNNPVTLVDATGHDVLDSVIGVSIGVAEITAGVSIDVASDGALEPIGAGLIGGGIAGVQYSATSSNDFSWRQFGDQEAIGIVLGSVTGGFGEVGEEAAAAGLTTAEETSGEATSIAGAQIESEATGDVASTSVAETSEGETDGDEGAGCMAGSFVAGTLVSTGHGQAKIEDLRSGDTILSQNAIDGIDRTHAIARTMTHQVSTVTALTIAGSAGSETLSLTGDHPLALQSGGWIRAGQVTAGTRLQSMDGKGVVVTAAGSSLSQTPVAMFNFDARPDHTYFAGANAVLVHNWPPGDSGCIEEKEGSDEGSSSGATRGSDEGSSSNPVVVTISKAEQIKNRPAYPRRFFNRKLTIDRIGAKARRKEAMRGKEKPVKGMHRNEIPGAMFEEGGADASVEEIPAKANQSSGAHVGNRLRKYSDGTAIIFRRGYWTTSGYSTALWMGPVIPRTMKFLLK